MTLQKMTLQKNAFLPSVSIGIAVVISLGLSGCSTTNSPVIPPATIANTVSTNATAATPANAPNERERMLASLNLTPTQQAQLEQLRLQNRPKTQQLQAQIKQFNDKINQLKLVAQTIDDKVNLLGLYQDKHALTLQEQALHLAYEQKFLAMLSPLQRITYYQSLPENKNP